MVGKAAKNIEGFVYLFGITRCLAPVGRGKINQSKAKFGTILL